MVSVRVWTCSSRWLQCAVPSKIDMCKNDSCWHPTGHIHKIVPRHQIRRSPQTQFCNWNMCVTTVVIKTTLICTALNWDWTTRPPWNEWRWHVGRSCHVRVKPFSKQTKSAKRTPNVFGGRATTNIVIRCVLSLPRVTWNSRWKFWAEILKPMVMLMCSSFDTMFVSAETEVTFVLVLTLCSDFGILHIPTTKLKPNLIRTLRLRLMARWYWGERFVLQCASHWVSTWIMVTWITCNMHDILQTFIEMRKHANSHVTFFCFGAVGHEICEVPIVTSSVHRPNKTSLVFPTNFWKNSNAFGMFPNVFGFLGFVKSANTKNANPKIRSFNTQICTSI